MSTTDLIAWLQTLREAIAVYNSELERFNGRNHEPQTESYSIVEHAKCAIADVVLKGLQK